MSDPIRPLSELLSDRPSTVRSLLARANYLRELQNAIRAHLSAPWSRFIRVANVRDRTLILYADNASAMTQMRFRSADLLAFLRERFGTAIQQVDIKVRPSTPTRA